MPVHPMLKTGLRSGACGTETANTVLGPKKDEHHDWFDKNDEHITQLLHAKNQAYVEWQNDPSSKSKADKLIQSFKFLRSMASSDGQPDKEISERIIKASQALGILHNRVLTHHNVSLTTKLKVYRTVVLISLLYSSESWTIYCHHIRQLERFHM